MRKEILSAILCLLVSFKTVSIYAKTSFTNPTVTINKTATQPDPTTAVPIHFTVVFDQDVTGFDASDISFMGSTVTGTLFAYVTGSGSTFDVSVNGMNSSGNVVASVIAGAAINGTGQSSLASTSTDNVVAFNVIPHDLDIIKQTAPPTVVAGGIINYLITINNLIAGISGVTFTDQLPIGTRFESLQLISFSGTPAPFITTPPPGQNGMVILYFADLAPGANVTFVITVSVDPELTVSITNTATISGPPGDLNPANNSSTVITPIIRPEPVITCPADFTETVAYLPCNTRIDFANDHPATATGFPTPGIIYTIINNNTQFTTTTSTTAILSTGEYTVTATATNSAGTASCSFNLSIVGAVPVITCPGDYTVYTSTPTCFGDVHLATGDHAVTYGNASHIAYSWIDENGNTGEPTSEFVRLSPGVYTFTAEALGCGVSTSCSFVVTVAASPVKVICPANVFIEDVNNDCQEEISLTGNYNVAVQNEVSKTFEWMDANGNSGSVFTNSFGTPPPFIFPVGINFIKVVASGCAGTKDSCTFTVTVTESIPPVITCPSNITVSCASNVPAVSISDVIATDNCGKPTVTHVSDVISEQTCTNKFKVTRTYLATDRSGNTATCTQTIIVNDNVVPQITGLTTSKQILAPPNHKMQDVTINYTVTDNCVSAPATSISITSNEPINGTGDGDTDPDWEIIDNHHIRLRAERSAQGTGRIYTISVTVNDGCNAPVFATTEVRVAHNITGPHSGNSFKVGSTVAFTGEFWDMPGNTHSAKWLIDGNITAKAIVTEPSENKNGKVTGSYKFTSPGVYKLQMNVTDQKGVTTYANTNGDVDAIVVIYDPSGGNTYGGGYFNSSAGALTSNSTAIGKASYGFAMNYFKNSTNPKGETQFEFKVGGFEFNALNFEYLVISNSMAQFKGTGKIIGGQSGIGFTMTVVDGQLDGTGVDKIRMKIYNKNNGSIIYDNQPGASDAALPEQPVGENSIIVISGTQSRPITANRTENTVTEIKPKDVTNEFDVFAFPNPSRNNFTLQLKGNANEKITLQVIDIYGRIIETRNVTANSITRFGDRYSPGAYFVRIMQGKEHKEIKLIKLTD